MADSKAELLSLQQVRCFCAALELGSFSAAADALRVSQPAVAEQVRKLERALGADLFIRAGRGVIPTDAVRQSGFRALDDAAREEAATIMDGLEDLMLPAYPHRR